ncbi:MAG: transcriptional repressor [Caldilineales bacterium]|nr:transcriptional repressor [Caldilineales bacterium]
MSHNTIDYAERIRSQGFRLTPQRQLILDAVCEGDGHTSIDEIYERVHHKSPAINRSTVYRTLDFLREVNLVVDAEIGGHTVFEIANDHPHHHLVCQTCGVEIEISQESLAPSFAAIERESGFMVDSNHLVLAGLCEKCRGDIE